MDRLVRSTVLAFSVAGMAVTMSLRKDPDSSLVMMVAFATFAIALAVLSIALYRPLLRSTHRTAAAPPAGGPEPENSGVDGALDPDSMVRQ